MLRSATGTLTGAGEEMRIRFAHLNSNLAVAAQAAAQGLQMGDLKLIVTPPF
jgi:hypothetical protein